VTDVPPMTPAELKCIREFLGLTTSWMAEHVSCDERRLLRMEIGKAPIPDAIADAVDDLYADTAAQVDRLTTKYKAQLDLKEGPVVMPVYRNDDEYEDAFKHARFPVRWHRLVAMRVADRLPALQLDYAIKVKRKLPPWEREEQQRSAS
jgi:hypothetical protein